MTVEISWRPPVVLGPKATFKRRLSQFDVRNCPEEPGLYIFARKFGKKLIEPIYIGKATNIRRRLKFQFNNYRLIEALNSGKAGDRILLIGTIRSKADGVIRKKLTLAERTHIEHALTAGYPLINVQMTKGPIDR